MDKNFGLPQRTIDELLAYFQNKTEVEKVVIYGSRAKGTYKNGSDIDFAVWTKDNNAIKIGWELDDLDTPYKFDVINYNSEIYPPLKKSIDTDGKIFYIKNNKP